MRSKRLMVLILALAMVWTLAACNSENEVTLIGVCVDDAKDPWTEKFLKALEFQLTEQGYEMMLLDSGGDQSVQNTQVDELIGDKVKGLVIVPCMSTGAQVLMEKLSAANVPAILCRREISADVLESYAGAAFVGVNRTDAGTAQADVLLLTDTHGDMNGDGKISYILLQMPADHLDTVSRTAGVLEGLTMAGYEMTELAVQCAEGDAAKAQTLCDGLMRQFGPDVEVIISNDDAMALGAAEAIAASGGVVGQNLYIVGADGSRSALEAVKLGTLTGTVVEDVAGQAEKAVEILGLFLSGIAVEQVHYVPYIPVTAKNVDVYLAEGG